MSKSLLTSIAICVLGIVAMSCPAFSAERERELFNGKDLDGWEGLPGIWSVQGDAIVGSTVDHPIDANTFLVRKEKMPSNFRLTLEYKIEGGNSGIQYRSRIIDPKKWIVGGYQADIDSSPTHTGILYEERGRGILTKRGQRVQIGTDGKSKAEDIADAVELQKSIHTDDWNAYVIEVIGSHLKHTINDKLMSETDDLDPEKRSVDGVLALQVHAGPPMTVRFRNIRLEEVDANSEQKDAEPGAKGK